MNPCKSVMSVRRGKFYRLFNALLPADDAFHELGVPECHKPLVSSLLDHIDEGSLSFNNYCSARVSVEADPGYHSLVSAIQHSELSIANIDCLSPDDFWQVAFQYRGTQGAVVLSLPVTAQREDTLAQDDLAGG
jgi:hypothetical protein